MATTTKTTLVSLAVVIIGFAFFYFLYSKYSRSSRVDSPKVATTASDGGYVMDEAAAIDYLSLRRGEYVPSCTNPLAEHRILFKEGKDSYVLCVAPKGGDAWPVFKESSTTSEYQGIDAPANTTDFSADKRRFVTGVGARGFCVVQIYPREIKCIKPANGGETFLETNGAEQFIDGEWIDKTHYKFKIYEISGNNSEPTRTVLFAF